MSNEVVTVGRVAEEHLTATQEHLATMGNAGLVAEGLVKTYNGTRALDGFTLAVAPGEIVGLTGRNGAGKTTFVEVVSGLVRPEAGRVRV